MRAEAAVIVIVSWVHHHGRSEGMARALDARMVFMPWGRPRGPLPYAVASWVRSAWRTARVVRSLPAGSTVVVMTPPVFAPLTVLAARWRRPVALAVDVHSGALNDPRWRWSYPLMDWILRRCDMVVATNREILERVELDPSQVSIVHDLLEFEPSARPPADSDRTGPPVVVFPASGAPDEPIEVVNEAADLLGPSVRIVVTGRRPDDSVRLEQVGYLPRDEYRSLLAGASAVLTLTTREATMQQAAYEALHVGVPVVCSDTRVLRESLQPAAVVVSHNAASIAAGIREALARHDELAAAAREVDARLRRDSERGLAALRALSGAAEAASRG